MRSLEECREKVFRRSEKRILARRRRVRALMVCVPLVLCITVFSLLIPTGRNHADPSDGHPHKSSGNTSPRAGICRIDVSRADKVTSITGEERIRAIIGVLTETGGPTAPSGGSSGEADGCTITLLDGDGVRAVYLLTGDTLTNQDTGRIIFLTREQGQALWALLLPETADS